MSEQTKCQEAAVEDKNSRILEDAEAEKIVGGAVGTPHPNPNNSNEFEMTQSVPNPGATDLQEELEENEAGS